MHQTKIDGKLDDSDFARLDLDVVNVSGTLVQSG